MSPKIMLFDVETAPMLSYHWQRYNINIHQPQVVEEGHVLCWYAKELGEDNWVSSSMDDYDSFESDIESGDDYNVVHDCWTMLDEADVVIGHNIKQFDHKVMQGRFMLHGLGLPSPYKMIDTRNIAKQQFRLSSNKLEDLSILLGIGKKKGNEEGFELWRKCLKGDTEAWGNMNRYCKNDVDLLEEVFLRLRPYIKNPPNMGVLKGENVCPNCGSSHIQSRGYATTQSGVYQRFQCQEEGCAHWFRGDKMVSKPTSYRSIS